MILHKQVKIYAPILLFLGVLGLSIITVSVQPGAAQAPPVDSGGESGTGTVETGPGLEQPPFAPTDSLPPPVMRPLPQEDELHLNTIGAFSAGFVLQSYGYIGVLADVLSKDVYSPELVREMLGETIKYLRNLDQQLDKYKTADIAAGDRKFIAQIQEIIVLLQAEAEALSAFAKDRDKEDLDRFESARKNAWSKIRKTLGMS